jgi:23S rRNA (guanosine2251-2'-O)-methyltransferase
MRGIYLLIVMRYHKLMKEFIYGRNPVYETMRAGRRQVFRLEIAQGVQEKDRLAEIIHLAEERKIPILRAPRSGLDRIHPGHQGVILEASGYPYAELTDLFERAEAENEDLFVLLLDTLNDPQNFGTLLRTAEAVGVHGAIIPLRQTVTVTPAVVSVSSGASEHLLIAQYNLHQAITTIKQAGAWIIGLDAAGEVMDIANPTLGAALGLVIGSEGEGMRPLVRKSCDLLMRLPMHGRIESLNAAAAGSVALYLAYLNRQMSSHKAGEK